MCSVPDDRELVLKEKAPGRIMLGNVGKLPVNVSSE